ncbi:MAG TPA: hypothetical protein VER39_00815 [Nocardioidaceae bacterium]|nr:hypothetical protein [Nocardioidaceae bacterium]
MAGLLLTLVLGGGVLTVAGLGGGGPSASTPPGDAPAGSASGTSTGDPRTPSSNPRDLAAAALLESLQGRLAAGGRQQVADLGVPDDLRVRRELAALRRNARVLRVADLDLHYLGDGTRQLTSAQQRALPPGAWVGEARLRWRLRGYDQHPSERVVPVTFATTGRGTRLLTLRRGYGAEVPLWLTGRVHVTRTPRSLVVATRADRSAAIAPLADRAVLDVRRVLSRWRGRLVVEVPDDRRGLSRVLGSQPGDYRGIAAVTTTVDGSDDDDAPEHIFVNPPVFDPLGARGSQVVLSHEATHVATAAAVSSLPTWLVEGFADYVALRELDLPVTLTAGQVLARVRRGGPPARLPGPAEFDARGPGLGASYEAAWLACRLLARTYGERRLVRFYRAADRESSTAEAFRTVLGTDERAFTRAWRAELRRLAG